MFDHFEPRVLALYRYLDVYKSLWVEYGIKLGMCDLDVGFVYVFKIHDLVFVMPSWMCIL